MDETTWVIALVGILIGAGGLGAFIPLFKIKSENESSIIAGAQSAVISLTAALKQSETRVTKLEEENQFLKLEIQKLVKDVEAAKKTMNELTKQLNITKIHLDGILNSKDEK